MTEILETRGNLELKGELFSQIQIGYNNHDTDTLQEFIKQEIETAYKAGMRHFNAFDHTQLDMGRVEEVSRVAWHRSHEFEFLKVNEDLLISLYLKSKGYE